MLNQFSGTGTGNGTTPTAALMKASQVGWDGGVWSLGGSTGTMPWTFETAAAMPLLNSTGRLCNGSTYGSGTPSFGLTMSGNSSSTGINIWEYNLYATPARTVTAQFSWNSSLPQTDGSDVDCATIHGQSDFAAVNCYSTGGANRILQMGDTGRKLRIGLCHHAWRDLHNPASISDWKWDDGRDACSHCVQLFRHAGFHVQSRGGSQRGLRAIYQSWRRPGRGDDDRLRDELVEPAIELQWIFGAELHRTDDFGDSSGNHRGRND